MTTDSNNCPLVVLAERSMISSAVVPHTAYRVDTFMVYVVFAPSEPCVYSKLRMRKVLKAPKGASYSMMCFVD